MSVPRSCVGTVFLAVLVGGGVQPAQAQTGVVEWSDCDIVAGTTMAQYVGVEQSGAQLVRTLTPRLLCADGTRIEADSAHIREIDRTAWLWGDVRYTNESAVLTAPFAVYYENGDSLRASGGARLDVPTSGSYAEAPVLRYRQAGDYRAVDTLFLGGGRTLSVLRPRVGASGPGGLGLAPALPGSGGAGGDTVIVVVDSATAAVPEGAQITRATYEVRANYQIMVGEESAHAWDDVVITRDSLVATGDSAHMDQGQDRLFIQGSAKIAMGEQELEGHAITAFIPEGEIREIISRRDAVLTGRDLVFDAWYIYIEMLDGQVETIVGTGDRPVVPVTPPAGEPISGDSVGVVEDSAAAAARSAAALEAAALAAARAEAEALDPEPGEPGEEEPEPDPQPTATSPDLRVTGDSIHLDTPGGIVDRLFATGSARLELLGRDFLNRPETDSLIREDWVAADSIDATFGSPETEGSGGPGSGQLERLEAHGNVTALFRVIQADSTSGAEIVTDSLVQLDVVAAGVPPDSLGAESPPEEGESFSVHYIAKARSLILELVDGALRRLEIEGPAHALFLQPAGRGVGGGS